MSCSYFFPLVKFYFTLNWYSPFYEIGADSNDSPENHEESRNTFLIEKIWHYIISEALILVGAMEMLPLHRKNLAYLVQRYITVVSDQAYYLSTLILPQELWVLKCENNSDSGMFSAHLPLSWLACSPSQVPWHTEVTSSLSCRPPLSWNQCGWAPRQLTRSVLSGSYCSLMLLWVVSSGICCGFFPMATGGR